DAVIAQEVESVLPEAVQTQSSGTKMVDYTRLVPLLIEAVKAQQKQIEQLRLELNSLRHETLK
ncbi:MAG: secretion protein Por, partial [Candidatus Margulisiibacteriota bacterium]